jgi:hypothetical protein
MVATAHWAARFLLVDLRIDEISATGSHQFFARNQYGRDCPLGSSLPIG